MTMNFNDFYLNEGFHFTKNYLVTKKLVVYNKNKPKIIEVTVGEEILNKVKVTTRRGKEMWVNKKELF